MHGSNLLYPGLSWYNPSSSMFDMPGHNTHHAETCRRISLAHLENCSYCSYLLMSIMSHGKTFTWLVLSHRITFLVGWLPQCFVGNHPINPSSIPYIQIDRFKIPRIPTAHVVARGDPGSYARILKQNGTVR